MAGFRIGQGYDVHAFGPGHQVVLGGITIPHDRGLVAHSDGDVVLHALCDALLGALALGDLGRWFPDSSEQWRGADSMVLLDRVYAEVSGRGWRLGNADLTVICQKPKIAPHVEAMRRAVAARLGADTGCVSIKATTTEGLGFTGRGEGIAAMAIVLLEAA